MPALPGKGWRMNREESGRAEEDVDAAPFWLRLRRSTAARSVLYAFVLTRLVVFVVLVIGGQINLIMYGSGSSTRDMELRLGKIPIARVLRETAQGADVNWYQRIAAEGYERIPFNASSPHNWAFFPLFPLLWRAAAALTGEFILTGILLSNALFLLALFLVYGAAREFGLDAATAGRAVFYLAAFPTSHFYSLPLTESLFLALAAGSLYAGRRRAWWLAALLGALASGTRFVGIVLLPTLFLLHLQTYGRNWRRASALWLCLVPAGLLAYMAYLHSITGNAFAFRDVLVQWGRRPGFFLLTLLEYLKDPSLIAAPWDFRLLNFLAPTVALACGVWLLRRREWALAAFTLLLVTASLSSLLLQSQARYAMTAFPIYFVFAEAAATRPRLERTLGALSLTLLALMTALFAGHFSMAMA